MALARIVEPRRDPAEREIGLCNGGIMAIDARICLISSTNRQRQRQARILSDDIVAIARAQVLPAASRNCRPRRWAASTHAPSWPRRSHPAERLRGRVMQDARRGRPETVFCRPTRSLGATSSSAHVVFGPGVSVADNVRIRSFSHLEGATIAKARSLAVRPLRLARSWKRGACRNSSRSRKPARCRAKANHLSYLGDSEIGAEPYRAGTITCNYDGFNKHRRRSAGRVYRSNTALVAGDVGDGRMSQLGAS